MPEARVPELDWHGTYRALRPTGFSTGWRSLAQLIVEAADGPGWRVETRDHGSWTSAAGEGHAILPHTEHRLTMTGPPCRSTWTTIDCAWSDGSDPLAGRQGAVRIPRTTMAQVARLRGRLTRLDGVAGWAAALQRTALRHALLLALPLPWSEPPTLDPRIRSVLLRIDAEPHRHFACRELAAAAGLGPAQFHALFRRAVGLSPLAWMERRRIRLAQHLLAGTALPIAAVAERCGYADPFHFSRVFRRLTRQSPRAFRRTLLPD